MVVGFLVFFPESIVQGWERGAQLHLDLECNSHILQFFNIAERSDPYSETDLARDLERNCVCTKQQHLPPLASVWHTFLLC